MHFWSRASKSLAVFLSIFFLLTNGHTAERPNIILIMEDDMGFSDLGFMGGEIDTLNLDSLAAGGVRFSQFCNPSNPRAASGLNFRP